MEEQKHAEIPSNPSLYKSSYLSEKNILITWSVSKLISVIYFSIKITIKEERANKGGHVNPGSTVKNYRKMIIKWSFSYNSFVKSSLYSIIHL